MSKVKIVRHGRGAEYRISVANGSGRSSLTVDGASLEGTLVPYATPGSVVEITVEM